MVDPDFTEGCLKFHNTLRALHNSPDLVLDMKLNDFAQDWALTLASADIFEHRQENNYGENIYVGYNTDPQWKLEPKVPVQMWYSEGSAYIYGDPTPVNISSVGHFTQMIWKASKNLGVGKAKNEASGKVYVVCNYDPAGNMIGEFAENVLPPIQAGYQEANVAASTAENVVTKDSNQVESEVIENIRSEQGGYEYTFDTASAAEGDVIKDSNYTEYDETDTIVGAQQPLRHLTAEELNIWMTWLTNVADTATSKWHEWLLAHINLILKLREHLEKAEAAINLEKQQQDEQFDSDKAKSQTTTTRYSADVEETEKEENEVNYIDTDRTIINGGMEIETYKVTKHEIEVKTSSFESEAESPDPILQKSAAVSVDENDVSQTIPMPLDADEMLQMIKEFQQQARKYDKLYKRWQKKAEKIIDEIVAPDVPRVRTEKVSSFFDFLVGAKADNDEDEEEGLISEDGQEKITFEELNLFFNLNDEELKKGLNKTSSKD